MVTERKSSGQRRSKQREVILEELTRLKTHPRSDELYAIVRRRLPQVSLGTVYRNLDKLQRDGLAMEIYCGDFVRYDGNALPHDHFLCRACRRVWDFDSGQRGHDNPESPSRGAEGFRIDGAYTTLFGLCPDCLSSSPGSD